jgi:hypothetical protein
MMPAKRPVGRPRLADEPSAKVQMRLPAAMFDKAAEHARTKRESIQDTIRRGLKRLLDDERG